MTKNLPSMRMSLSDLVTEYEAKKADIPRLAQELQDAASACETGTQIGGSYAHVRLV